MLRELVSMCLEDVALARPLPSSGWPVLYRFFTAIGRFKAVTVSQAAPQTRS